MTFIENLFYIVLEDEATVISEQRSILDVQLVFLFAEGLWSNYKILFAI